MLGVNQRMAIKLFGREIIFEEFQPIWPQYLIVTDGQTDGRSDGRLTVASPRSARALLSRGKKTSSKPIVYRTEWNNIHEYRYKNWEAVQ